MKNKIILFFSFFTAIFLPQTVGAWECYVDPVYDRDLWGQYNTAAYVLERECSGTAKLETVPAGTVLHIIAETDGWYKVETNNGNIGWTGSRLITLVEKPTIVANSVVTDNSQAASCDYGEVRSLSKEAWISDNANIRNVPCTDASVVLELLPAGTAVEITGEIDSWYRIKRSNGTEAWVVNWLVDFSQEEKPEPVAVNTNTVHANSSFRERTKGQLLLQVQQHGEIWYVDPISYERYHATVENALPLFRKLSLGITNADLAQIPLASGANSHSTALGLRLKGRLLLAVEDLGRVWYIDLNGFRQEVRQDNIMTLFRSLGLGITDADLLQIPLGDLSAFSDEIFSNNNQSDNSVNNTEHNTWQLSAFQRGQVPTGIDLAAANDYWLSEINKLRAVRGLRQLVLDQRFVDTATEWASYMGEDLGYTTHTRPDGKSMHQWIDTKDLDWTVRYSHPDAWVTNYFTENIAWNYIDGTNASLEHAMDYTIDWMLAEASYNGDHYRTIYHADWNSVGLGFYFKDMGNGRYQVFIAMHYGSLQQ